MLQGEGLCYMEQDCVAWSKFRLQGARLCYSEQYCVTLSKIVLH